MGEVSHNLGVSKPMGYETVRSVVIARGDG